MKKIYLLYLHHCNCGVNLWWKRNVNLVLVSVNPKVDQNTAMLFTIVYKLR